jgi:leucyl/phenylalanyl-tRNA--protein transferase
MRYHRGITILEVGDELPNPRFGPTDEPVAIGSELSPTLMLTGYRKGLFAWSANPVTWWSPDPRAIIPLDKLRISKRLARKIKTRPFEIKIDCAFSAVVAGCAQPRHAGDGIWISRPFRRAFAGLHELGHAHSVECWLNEKLVGGIFGVAVNGLFSAESMFHTATDASKVALFVLVETLRANNFQLLDIQILTPHTASLGAHEISRLEYLNRLERAVQTQTSWNVLSRSE